MAYWSVYVSKEDEVSLKRALEKLAQSRRWSFSQAVAEVLREHLIEEGKCLSEDERWDRLAARQFFEGYSEKDAVYDKL
jgi:hypothetical protein